MRPMLFNTYFIFGFYIFCFLSLCYAYGIVDFKIELYICIKIYFFLFLWDSLCQEEY